jgi:hypothetical protein
VSSKRKTCDRIQVGNGWVQYVFRGSEFAMCQHRHIACLRGLTPKPPSPFLRKIFDAGNASEPVQKATLERMGFRMLEFASGWENQISVSLQDRDEQRLIEVLLKVSPDGRVQCPPVDRYVSSAAVTRLGAGLRGFKQYAVENKALGEDNFRKAEARGLDFNESYKAQLSAACWGFREREKRDDIGCIFMAQLRNKDATLADRFLMWVYEEPPLSREEVMRYCWDIVELDVAREWPKCNNKFPCDYPTEAPIGEELALGSIVAEALRANNALRAALVGKSLPIETDGMRVHWGESLVVTESV